MASYAQSVAPRKTPCDIAAIRQEFERRMGELLPKAGGERDLVALAMGESTLAPGKRLRPMLLILAARNLGYDHPALLDLACAVEMVHSASLVLDDMPCMDNARLRRGRPTIHLHFGEDVAILAAVALLSRAFSVIASTDDIAPAIRTQLVSELANSIGMQGLVKGQYEDLREGARARTAEEIAATNEHKTGALFGATLEMAAIIAGSHHSKRMTLRSFALELGQAFQLFDDLLDHLLQNGAAIGKDVTKDKDKSTLVALLGADAVRAQLERHLRNADAHLATVYGDDQTISAFIADIFAPLHKLDAGPLANVQKQSEPLPASNA